MQLFSNSGTIIPTTGREQWLAYRKIKNRKAWCDTLPLDDQLRRFMLQGSSRQNIYESLRYFWLTHDKTKEVKEACKRWLERNGRLNARA